MEVDFKGDREEFEENERELCPDGNCTGLIGVDGRCKLCGLGKDGSRAAAHEEAHPAAHEDGGFDDDRKLCPDGSCTGLVGDDGRCKVCGTS